ncbi:MAG: hypothetical protein RIC06_15980 [Cyclobacteriaceae bacterium]
MKDFIKNAMLFTGLTFGLLLISCNKDDDGTPAYEFKDQNLQGQIDGIDFNLGDGAVDSFNGELSFNLYSDQESTAVCELFGFGDFVQVFFAIPAETGVLELFINFSSGEGETVTMFNPDGSLNIIATVGAVDITEITETTVSGRMDIKYDGSSFLNGNFTVGFCE